MGNKLLSFLRDSVIIVIRTSQIIFDSKLGIIWVWMYNEIRALTKQFILFIMYLKISVNFAFYNKNVISIKKKHQAILGANFQVIMLEFSLLDDFSIHCFQWGTFACNMLTYSKRDKGRIRKIIILVKTQSAAVLL